MDIKKLNFSGNQQSKNLYADWKCPVMVDGEGVRGSVYLSGCLFNCKGCYNKSIQNFGAGKPLTDQVIHSMIKDLNKPYIQGLTLLGGDPFFNAETTLKIVTEFRKVFGWEKDIWCWTGYSYEELMELTSFDNYLSRIQRRILENIDVLVDGRFKQEEFAPDLTFRGSKNQRIIDIQSSLYHKKILLWKDGKYK